MKFYSKVIRHKNLIIFVASVLCIFHLWTMIYFSNEESKSNLPMEGSLEVQLSATHFALLILLIGYLLTLIFNSVTSRIISLVAGLLMMSIYYFWYHEKFKLLSSVTYKGEEYNWMAERFGVLRGATSLDYLAFYLTVILVSFSLFKLIYFFIHKAKTKSYK